MTSVVTKWMLDCLKQKGLFIVLCVEKMLYLLKCIYTSIAGLILVLLILYFQILFTITFWLLLRQHLTEQKALREKEALLSEVKIETQEIEEKGK